VSAQALATGDVSMRSKGTSPVCEGMVAGTCESGRWWVRESAGVTAVMQLKPGRAGTTDTESAMTTQKWNSIRARVTLITLGAAFMIGGPASAQTYTVTDLGTLGGGQSNGIAINAAGQVTGDALTPAAEGHAFLFTSGVMTDLGTLGATYSRGHSINATGQVTGYFGRQDNTMGRAFLYSGGVMTDLGALGGRYSTGLAINEPGQVTGFAVTADNVFRAFLYDSGVMRDLGTLGGANSWGNALNTAGQVTGESETAAGERHAFRYSDGVMTHLGTLGGTYSEGFAINDGGQVTGYSTTGDNNLHAFLYSNGVMKDLGTLGGTYSVGFAVNAAGQVTGDAATTAGGAEEHGFLYSGGVMTDLGTLGGTRSSALAINARGQVTGWSTTASGIAHAFLYRGGALIDLNTLIPSGSGWILKVGNAINDRGQITGWGTIDGENRAFLLTPIAPTMEALVQQPIDVDGSSVFSAKRGVIPVKFMLSLNGTPTCQLPPATMALTRTAIGSLGEIGESLYLAAADSGTSFRISDCQYVYNLPASSLGTGHYRVDIVVNGAVVGRAEFSIK